MTQDDLFRPEGDASPDKKSSGCGLRFLLILLVSVTGLSLLCCCGIGISMYSMVPKIEDDPAVAQQTLDELLQIKLPERFTPEMAIRMNVLGFINVKGVIVESTSKDGMLIVVRLRGSLVEQGDFVTQIEDSIKDEVDDSDMVIESRETRQFEIDGQPVEFTFLKGRRNDGSNQNLDEQEGEESQEETEPVSEDADAQTEVETVESAPAEPATDAPASPTESETDTDTAPADNEAPAEQPAENGEGKEDDARVMRQVRALIPGKDGPTLFLLIVPEDEWNEQEVVDMIESIELK